ncbi:MULTISPECIES: SWIM zinc finger family protein [Nocardia]
MECPYFQGRGFRCSHIAGSESTMAK